MSMSESGRAKPRAWDPPRTTATTFGTFRRASAIALSVRSFSSGIFAGKLSTSGLSLRRVCGDTPFARRELLPVYREREKNIARCRSDKGVAGIDVQHSVHDYSAGTVDRSPLG